ncbi:MAG TPA: SIS domain-containing protein [Candidatus Dormibacteraeota bacterium]|nr:SIS domain-containing protein [Candidatus Dormibacteraeota bacterium]
MSIFGREIAEQPAVAARLLDDRGPVVEAARAIQRARPVGFLIAARGSSDHAAIYARYLFEIRNRIPVALAAPSAFGLYRRPPKVGSWTVIGISQSGASADVCEVLEEAGRQGALTIAITNRPESRLGRAARLVLDLRAGRERSVPASKTYTASLLLLALLSAHLDPDPELDAALPRVPEALARALEVNGRRGNAVEALKAHRLAVLGRGYHLATAAEVALKITETSYSVAEARSTADFLHGPVAAIEPGFPVLLLEASGPTLRHLQNLRRRLQVAGATVVRITDRPRGDRLTLTVRSELPESLTPLPFAVAGQLLALELAAAHGLDPDRPRRLRKVTITR